MDASCILSMAKTSASPSLPIGASLRAHECTPVREKPNNPVPFLELCLTLTTGFRLTLERSVTNPMTAKTTTTIPPMMRIQMTCVDIAELFEF
ncbi:hypothetical protein PsorP6_009877 [Peronosclerospora sorghi]|uniref:Uncharacterized protein n=1 Tax=Peronosclerospora sorghi TaxID=230839 RepID=A0ACC0W281_9STRA|nr:hypothetical protein PsorP6_009877 [Peronosclerospora sorghi]